MNKFRCYSCYYYANVINPKTGKKHFVKNSNFACWASINYWDVKNEKDSPNILYIDEFKGYVTNEQINQLIYIINKITPCRIIKYKDKEYIAIRLINNHKDWYNNNLIILNWIRCLWYKPYIADFEKFYKLIFDYTDNMDPLYFLMDCNRQCLKESSYGFNHSNFGKDIIPKEKKYLFEKPYKQGQSYFMKLHINKNN